VLFEGAIIVISERVDATDFMPIGEQALSQMRTHKASDTGYETSHDFSSVFFLFSCSVRSHEMLPRDRQKSVLDT
jgi:hypothetical protein